MRHTRLTSKVRRMNNAGITVGFVDDFHLPNAPPSLGFPKACVWLPSGACFTLDETTSLPAGNLVQ